MNLYFHVADHSQKSHGPIGIELIVEYSIRFQQWKSTKKNKIIKKKNL